MGWAVRKRVNALKRWVFQTQYFGWFYVFVPSKFISWNCNAQYDGIGMWGLWRLLGQEGRILINEINDLIKKKPESPLASFLHMRIQEVCDLEEVWWHAGTLISDFPAFKTVRNKILFLKSYPICGIQVAPWMEHLHKTDGVWLTVVKEIRVKS